MNELERKPTSSDSMRVRCPYCRKLYMVQLNDMVEANPRFECVDCRTRFWLSLPDVDWSSEVVGIPVQMKSTPLPTTKAVRTEPCPKCFKSNPVGATDCTHCGVVIAKVRDLDFIETRITPPRSETLALAWKSVISNYGEDSAHDNFLKIAVGEGHLTFAAFQYGQMLKLMPNDESTLKRVRVVQTLGLEMIPPVLGEPPNFKQASRLWQIFLFLAVLTFCVGWALPNLGNLSGVGMLLLILSVFLKLRAI